MSAKVHLCDGDCGNVYYDIDLNRTCDGQDLCKDCMFNFVWDKECDQSET